MTPLTEREVSLLAEYIAIRHIRNVEDWLEWEDLPGLSQSAFERVESAVVVFAERLTERLVATEVVWRIDSRFLHEVVS